MNEPSPRDAPTPTVFVVDDDPGVRKSFRWLMESVGLKVRTYGSALEFLAEYDPLRPGCLILDLRMPGMTGWELQERLQTLGATLPVIVITAYGDVPQAVRAIKAGAVHFFEKPVDDQVLLDHVRQALAQAQQRRLQAQLAADLRERYARLTPREVEVLEKVVEGHSSKQIAYLLGVSHKTVEAHRAKIMRKMQADSLPQLITLYWNWLRRESATDTPPHPS